MEKFLHDVYIKTFPSRDELYFLARKKFGNKVTRKKISDFLKSKDSYTLHRLNRRNFLRENYLSPRPGVFLTSDLAEVGDLAKFNDGVRFLIFFLDVFSRHLTVYPMHSKSARETSNCIKKYLDNSSHNYKRLHTDEGSEFVNRTVQTLLDKHGIKLYHSKSRDIKAGVAEIYIRHLKTKLYRSMTERSSQRYLDHLQIFVDHMNAKPKTLLSGFSSNFVHNTNDGRLIRDIKLNIYKRQRSRQNNISFDLNVGSFVRLSKTSRSQNIFSKKFREQNTREIFLIYKVDRTSVPVTYYLKDIDFHEPIIGKFYRQELIEVTKPKNFRVEILSEKIINRKKHYLVNWVDYPEMGTSLIPYDDMI